VLADRAARQGPGRPRELHINDAGEAGERGAELMFEDAIRFGIRTEDGTPYVRTCRGTFEFASAEDAAGFIAERSRARLKSQLAVWESFGADLERWQGSRASETSAFPEGF
jgi:hypothetical protein